MRQPAQHRRCLESVPGPRTSEVSAGSGQYPSPPMSRLRCSSRRSLSAPGSPRRAIGRRCSVAGPASDRPPRRAGTARRARARPRENARTSRPGLRAAAPPIDRRSSSVRLRHACSGNANRRGSGRAHPDQVEAAVERRPEHDVAAVVQVVEAPPRRARSRSRGRSGQTISSGPVAAREHAARGLGEPPARSRRRSAGTAAPAPDERPQLRAGVGRVVSDVDRAGGDAAGPRARPGRSARDCSVTHPSAPSTGSSARRTSPRRGARAITSTAGSPVSSLPEAVDGAGRRGRTSRPAPAVRPGARRRRSPCSVPSARSASRPASARPA